jgi:hypothetical protein
MPSSLFLRFDPSPGQDFLSIAEQQISTSDTVIVVVGPVWLSAMDAGNIFPNFERREIEWALERNKRVIPVLVRGAKMPRAEALPVSIRQLAEIAPITIRPELFDIDAEAVVRALRGDTTIAREASRYAVSAAERGGYYAALLALGALAGWLISMAVPYIVNGLTAFARTTSQVLASLVGSASEFFLEVVHIVTRHLDLIAVSVFGAAVIARILYVFRHRIIATAFDRWVRINWKYTNLGPNLGFVKGPLDEAVLRNALPANYPEPLQRAVEARASPINDVSISTEEHLRRAHAWASRLDETVRANSHIGNRRGQVMVTFGFISTIDAGIRLGIIFYLNPFRAFMEVAARRAASVEIEGWPFPIIVRPWLPIQHGSSASFGNCWVSSPQGRWGMLTARHAVRPKTLGKSVSIKVRRAPSRGQLLRASVKMDAALIAVPKDDWGGKQPVSPSPVIGYKPVRLLSSLGPTDGQVVELSGATIWAQAGQEPLNGNLLFFNPFLQPGDSGCLVLDREHESQPPYLMYLGKVTLNNGQSYGYGVLLEQARRIWNLEFFV